jgi:NTP pyrophosphatase (non-canonical NTP hydrolase)
MPMAAKGLAKLAEELGELTQVVGKKLAYFHVDEHPDGGPPLTERLRDEMGDVMGAIRFVCGQFGIPYGDVLMRAHEKHVQFDEWHEQADNNADGVDTKRVRSGEEIYIEPGHEPKWTAEPGRIITTVSYEWHDLNDGEAVKLPVGARVFVVTYKQALLGYFMEVSEGVHLGEGRFSMTPIEGTLLDLPPCRGAGTYWRRA